MKPTPAIRLHALARKAGLMIDEFSPGLRIWTIRDPADGYTGEPLAFGVPQAQLADRLRQLAIRQE